MFDLTDRPKEFPESFDGTDFTIPIRASPSAKATSFKRGNVVIFAFTAVIWDIQSFRNKDKPEAQQTKVVRGRHVGIRLSVRARRAVRSRTRRTFVAPLRLRTRRLSGSATGSRSRNRRGRRRQMRSGWFACDGVPSQSRGDRSRRRRKRRRFRDAGSAARARSVRDALKCAADTAAGVPTSSNDSGLMSRDLRFRAYALTRPSWSRHRRFVHARHGL